jgi:hypothetical protein
VPPSAATSGTGGGAGLKISPQNTNSATTAAQTKTTRTMAATGKFLAGSGALDNKLAFAMADGIGRSPVFVPVMINFGSSDSGACGAVIFWKHVGHSITVPLCDESHFMCWPHTGHAYLNSLMADGKAFHIRAPSATWFFWICTTFRSDFLCGSAQFGWRSGLSLPRTNQLKLELQQNEKNLSSLP